MGNVKGISEDYEDLNKKYHDLKAADVKLMASFQELQNTLDALNLQNRELKCINEVMRGEEELLKESQRVAQIGHYIFSIPASSWVGSEVLHEILGVTESYPHDINGWIKIVHPAHQKELFEYLTNQVIANKQPFNKEYKIIRVSDQQERWVLGLGNFRFDAEGNPIELFGITQDITERKIIEEALKESNVRLKFAMEGTNDGMWDVQLKTGSVYISPRGCEILGYDLEELDEVAKVWTDMVHPDDLPLTNQRLQDHLNGETPIFEVEQRLRMKSGAFKWIHTRGKVVARDLDGTPLRMTGTHTDISDRKLAQLDNAHSLNLLNYVIEHNNSGIAVFDTEMRYVYVSQKYMDEYKIKDISLIGKCHYDVFPEIPNTWKNIHKRALQGEVLREEEDPFYREDGTIDWTRWECRPWHKADGSIGGIIIYTEVINDRKQAEQILKESESRFSKIFQASPIAISIAKLSDGKFTDVNDVWCKITEFSKQEAIGHTLTELKLVEEANYKRLLDIFITTGSLRNEEILTTTKSGKKKILSTSADIITINGVQLSISMVIDVTEKKEQELQLKEKTNEIEAQNEEYRQLNEELYVAKEKAVESDRLKTAFLQNMSHEIRTPMNAIMGFSELLVHNYNNKNKLEHFSDIIKNRCNDLLDIINDLLDISKIESGQTQIYITSFSICNLFDELTLFFEEYKERQKKHNISLNIHHCTNEDVTLFTDIGKLKQIFINLISNAIKFTNEGSVEVSYTLDSDDYITFFIKDSGIGIPKNQQQFIFDRFAQVDNGPQRLYGGTGLGLSIVKGLLNILEGTIWVESEPNVGSTFYFTIPIDKTASETKQQDLKENLSSPILQHNKTILIVEDDIYNAEFIKEVLSDTGINLLFATYGKDAIQIALNQPIDFVLMDIGLPDMIGYEAISIIKEQRPELKIIAQSAYALEEDRQMAIKTGCVDYISKPVKSDLLLSLLNKYLQ